MDVEALAKAHHDCSLAEAFEKHLERYPLLAPTLTEEQWRRDSVGRFAQILFKREMRARTLKYSFAVEGTLRFFQEESAEIEKNQRLLMEIIDECERILNGR